MFIDTPQNTLKLAGRQEDITNDGTHYLMRMRRDTSMFFYENRDAKPSANNYAVAAQFFTEITEVEIGAEQAEAILALYPHTRIKIAKYDGIRDTEVRDGLSSAAAHFFLGCEWPNNGDNVDIDAFVGLLKQSANLMGFVSVAAEA